MEIPFIFEFCLIETANTKCSENKQIGKERVTLSYTSLKTEIIRRKTIVDYLVSFGLGTLYDRRKYLCIKLFNSISSDQHKVACLRPPKHQGYLPGMPRFRTNHFKKSFIPAMYGRLNMLSEFQFICY